MNAGARHIFWKVEDKKTPWRSIVDTEEEREAALINGAMYFSTPAMSHPYEETTGAKEPHRWSDFHTDFDDADDPAKSIADVKKLFVNNLGAYMDLDPTNCDYFLSGSKGMHVSIPAVCFGAEDGHPYLPLIYKKIAAKWATQYELKTLDMSIYNMKKGRMFRIANVKRSNGRYKVPVTLDELSLPVPELLALADAPRVVEHDRMEPEAVPALVDIYEAARTEVEQEILAQMNAEPMTEEMRQKLAESPLPLCVKYIVEKMPPKTETCNFNNLVLQLASYFRDAQIDDAKALEIVKPFLDGYSDSATYNTPAKRLEAWRSMVAYLKASTHYPFACSFVLGFKFKGNSFNCKQCPVNPQKKPARAEFEERIAATEDIDELFRIAKEVAASGLERSEIHRLLKILAKRCGCTIRDLKADAKAASGASDDDKPTQLEHVRQIVRRIGKDDVLSTTQGIWTWRKRGVWKEVHDRVVKGLAHSIMPEDQVTKSTVDSIVDLFKTEVFRPDHEFDVLGNSINCPNGELHWTGKGWELRTHEKQHYRTTQIPVPYDPAAQSPRFVQFLEEVFDGQEDAHERATLVCEMLGYTLLSTCDREKFMLLIGPGGNGKSKLLNVVAGLVGKANVTGVQPSQFENRFQRAHLAGRLANIVTEIAEGAEIADAQLKAIVSGELTTAEHKMKPPFDFRPFCTCWFGTNHMPHTRDFSDALFRRAFVLTFDRVFQEEEQDPDLDAKLAVELPGILNLALDGIARVIQRGYFTKVASSEDAKQEWRYRCDQVAQFVKDWCEVGVGNYETVTNIYAEYLLWAASSGIKKTLSKRGLVDRLCRTAGVSRSRDMAERRVSGVRVDPEKAKHEKAAG